MSLNNCLLSSCLESKTIAATLVSLNLAGTSPFEIKRVYYLYDIPGGASRAGHATQGAASTDDRDVGRFRCHAGRWL